MADEEGNTELNITPDQPTPGSSKVEATPLHLVSWSAGFLLAVFAGTIVLLAFRIPSALAAAWLLFSIAVLVISEGDGLRATLDWYCWQPPNESNERSIADLLMQLEKYTLNETSPAIWPLMRNLRTRRWSEALTVLILAALSLLASPSIGIGQVPNRGIPPELAQRLDRIEKDVTECREQKCTGHAQPNPTGGDNTVRFDPQIQKALLDFLDKEANGSAGKSPTLSFSWPIWVVIALMLAIAAGVLVLAFRTHPEAAPPVGAAGLAAAVIAKAGQFSHFDHDQEWALAVLAAFGLVTLVLATWFFQQIRKERDSTLAKDDPRLKSFSSLWLTLFSVFVLLWVLVLVCFQPAKEPADDRHLKPQSTPTALKIDFTLPAITGFVSKTKDEFPDTPANQLPRGIEQALLTRIQQDAPKDGDVLLLLGSADCVPFRGKRDGNSSLAEQRAEWVAGEMQSKIQALGVTSQPQPMPTHEGCRQADGLRAVYPILIQIKPAAR